MNWERKTILQALQSTAGTTADDKLLDWLQDHGLVSDNCVRLQEVPTMDLLKAQNKIRNRKPRLQTA
jgi:hypothetical protein